MHSRQAPLFPGHALTDASTMARWWRLDEEQNNMRDTDLFQMALGLVPPWLVSGSRFDAESPVGNGKLGRN